MNAAYNDLVAALRRYDYVADTDIAASIFLAEYLNKPILIEGEAGVGKTEIARVLSKLKDTELIRLQCYEGLDSNAALYEWNYQKQIISIRLNELTKETRLSIEDLYSEPYLLARPILKALTAGKKVVLLLDEIDRADEEFEALLLETLAEFQMTIPEFGTIKAKHAPYVILTSNRTRELTDALRRRCLYLWINYPSFQKEFEVIKIKVPEVGEVLAMRITSFVQAIRHEKLNKVPGLSEAIDWARALHGTGVKILDRESIEHTIGALLKDHDDLRTFKRDLVMPLLEKIDDGHHV
ncbi:MoxR family ATPase [Glaciimonas sp. PCH181]|uniref:AAA family ATPase n=1 Tax=Glaciimonas sp. PCH181 TaxID=2133943 RepID=UPI000D398A04|nr:MoxR family ATPase [Glaciimonas sp. PCH181]PUA19699.1 ATPase [Glaciimonas sp. PCH181]